MKMPESSGSWIKKIETGCSSHPNSAGTVLSQVVDVVVGEAGSLFPRVVPEHFKLSPGRIEYV